MTKVRVGAGVRTSSGRPSNIKVSEDGVFKGSQPEINFASGFNVTNDTTNNRVNVQNAVDLSAQLALKANIASPALTGEPTAPTQLSSDNSTKLVNTTWVRNFVGALPAESLFVDDKIQTSEGNTYSLTGMTSAQRGDQLQLAIDEASNNAGVIIFIPGGVYSRSSGFTWKKRNTALVGFARSKVCELTSDAADTLSLDVSYLLYNSVFSGFSVANTAGTKDAVRFTPIDGAAQAQSQIEMNIHIHQSSRDGLHIDDGFNLDCNLDIKGGGSLGELGVTRYAIYSDGSGAGINIIYRAIDGHVYLDTNSSNNTVYFPNIDYQSSSNKLTFTNLGSNNYLSSIGHVDNYRTEVQDVPVKYPKFGIPAANIIYHGLLDRTYSDIIPDASIFQNDGSKVVGTYSVVDTPFGKMIDLSGDCYFEVPNNSSINPTSKITLGFMFYIDSDVQSRLIRFNGMFDISYNAGTLTCTLNLGGTNRNRTATGITTGTYYLLIMAYDSATYSLTVNSAISSTSLSGLTIGTPNQAMRIGAFSSGTQIWNGKISPIIMVNDANSYITRAIKAYFLTNTKGDNPNVDRFQDNKLYADMEYQVDDKGVVLVDRTTATKYRLYVNSGTLSIEAV